MKCQGAVASVASVCRSTCPSSFNEIPDGGVRFTEGDTSEVWALSDQVTEHYSTLGDQVGTVAQGAQFGALPGQSPARLDAKVNCVRVIAIARQSHLSRLNSFDVIDRVGTLRAPVSLPSVSVRQRRPLRSYIRDKRVRSL